MAGSAGPLPPLRVLVVDDSAAARLLVADAVLASGRRQGLEASISEAVDGFEALRLLPRQKFDLVLTDVNMPVLSGLELIRLIRARPDQRHLPIIAISTERQPEDIQMAREAGADGYLAKPFEAATLDRLLTEVLEAVRGEA
jgi:two-component system chemotaxis response regulator CheY